MAEAKKTTKAKDSDDPVVDKSETSKDVADKPEEKSEANLAKAGKRSAKALKEQEEKEAKDTKKQVAEEEPKKKPQQKSARPRVERRGKRFRDSAKQIDKSKEYPLKEALELVCKSGKLKFDASVELHIRLNVDPKQADQNIRDSVVLPEGTGKSVKVAVVAEDAEAKKAKTAGASVAGVDEIFSKLDKEQIDFDVLVAVPELMQRLSKYARILGPKGLMPNPKSGTVTKEVEKAVKDALSGKVEYRVDSAGIVHTTVGKVSFGATRLHKNAQYIFESIKNKKPASVKSPYIKSFYVSSTMGPGVRVNTSEML